MQDGADLISTILWYQVGFPDKGHPSCVILQAMVLRCSGIVCSNKSIHIVNGEWLSLSFSFHDALLLLVTATPLRLALLPHGLPGMS